MGNDSRGCCLFMGNFKLLDFIESGARGNKGTMGIERAGRLRKWRSAGFIMVCCAFLCGPIGIFLAHESGCVELPYSIDPVRAQYLSGGKMESIDIKSKCSLEAFVDGVFQAEVEKLVKNHIPAKFQALMGNAALQRAAIGASNVIFGWECFPSYYGSGYIVCPELRMVLPAAAKETDENNDAALKFVSTVNKLQEKYPDIRFAYQTMNDTYTTNANPSGALRSDAMTEEWHERMIVGGLNERIFSIIESVGDREELQNGWFSSEHHWTAERALAAYNHLADLLQLRHYSFGDPIKIVDEWEGSSARGGLLFDFPSDLWDTRNNFSFLKAAQNGQPVTRGARSEILGDSSSLESRTEDAFYNTYHWYFGRSLSNVVYDNNGDNNGKNCLFVCQSYGVALEQYIASNYKHTVIISPALDKCEKSLDDYITEYDIDDVIIQFGAHPYATMLGVSPAIFE